MSTQAISQAPVELGTIRDWMVTYISSVIDVPQDPFPVAERFDNLGFDSVEITIMCGMMEEQFNLEVNPGEVFENPNVEALSSHIARRINERSDAA